MGVLPPSTMLTSCGGLRRPGIALRFSRVSGASTKVTSAYAGTDFIIARDGKIVALYLFFDELP
jgi:hypothetical protein